MKDRSQEYLEQHKEAIYIRTDRMFALLFALEYVAGIAVALLFSPLAWEGSTSSIHIHVWAATVLVALVTWPPMAMALWYPGRTFTRHSIAIAQMLYSAILIHLTGGRIETHFHIFGSLAFLGFYRDWKVLISASTVVTLDHFFRGMYWPQSVFGIYSWERWRWLEHGWWMFFENFFIILASQQGLKEMREMATHRAEIERYALGRAEQVARLERVESRLKEALNARDTFLSICSHELKTPLTGLKLQSQIARKRHAPHEKVVEFSSQVEEQVNRLNRLVDDMLDVSRIRFGKLGLVLENDVDLGKLVRHVAENVEKSLGSKELITIQEQAGIQGRWDKFRLEQVITNLITNSHKYGDGRPVQISVMAKDEWAILKVSDQGMGIAPEDQDKIFQRFERVTKNTSISGLGLGLYISRSIVEQHGGRISVESQIGQGATFTVELPTVLLGDAFPA